MNEIRGKQGMAVVSIPDCLEFYLPLESEDYLNARLLLNGEFRVQTNLCRGVNVVPLREFKNREGLSPQPNMMTRSVIVGTGTDPNHSHAMHFPISNQLKLTVVRLQAGLELFIPSNQAPLGNVTIAINSVFLISQNLTPGVHLIRSDRFRTSTGEKLDENTLINEVMIKSSAIGEVLLHFRWLD